MCYNARQSDNNPITFCISVLFFFLFHSNLTANAITPTSENANQLYTEIEGKEEQYIQTRETYASQQNENPLYESAADEAVSNPLYDRFGQFVYLLI